MKKYLALKMASLMLGGFICVGVLSGCSNSKKTELEYVDVSDLPNVSKSEIPSFVFNETDGTETSESTVNDNQSDNTEIEIFTNGNQSDKAEIEISMSSEYYSAVAEPVKFDVEKVKSVFFGNTNVIGNTINRPDRDPIYNWEYNDKKLTIINDNAMIEYSSDPATFINIIFGPPIQGNKGNTHLFEHRDDDLDFCTRDEAVKAVSDTLSELGISVYNKAIVYSLCQSDMQAVVDAECEKGDFYQFDDEWQRIPVTSYNVQKNQECYYIVFNADWNGIPIYNGELYYMTIKDLVIFQPKITAIYSAEGIVELKVEEYRSINQGEKISQLISPETAAQVVGEKYKDVVGIEKITFDQMSLMYVLTPYSENGKIAPYKTNLMPVWICAVEMTEYTYDRETGTQAPVTSQKYIFIDAQTGVEII